MTDKQNCRHQNIHWEDLFKPEKQGNNNYPHQDAYCIDCGETKGRIFAHDLQRWYHKKVEECLINNGLTEKIGNHHNTYQFTKFVKENGYEDQWNKLCLGRLHEDFDGLLGQGIFFEVARNIENLCYEFQKQQQSNPRTSSSNPKPRKNRQKNKNNPNNPTNNQEEEESPLNNI